VEIQNAQNILREKETIGRLILEGNLSEE